ncbi:MAG: hypothetical protein LBU23_02015 [Planctomycetota bacterium]|nr:hypothetical protein [Planctomycetota bacterium]
MGDAITNAAGNDETEQYEKKKSSFEVLDVYEIPVWYKNHIWLWPMFIQLLLVVVFSSPEGRLSSFLLWGLFIATMDVLMILVQKYWPI